MPSILNNNCTYHAAMATKINTLQIFLPTKNMKILPTKFNTCKVLALNMVSIIIQLSNLIIAKPLYF